MSNAFRSNVQLAVIGLLLCGSPALAAPTQDIAAQTGGDIVAEETTKSSVLEDGTSSVDPFASNDASAVIARPSLSQMFDSAVDFNNKEGTISLRVSPALLLTSYPDWYLTGLSLSGAANTEETGFSVGGKWDFNFRDARFYYALNRAAMDQRLNDVVTDGCAAPSADRVKDPETFRKQMSAYVNCGADNIEKQLEFEHELRKYRGITAFSIGGNASYDNDGHFGGGNATFAFDVKHKFGLEQDPKPKYPVTLSATLNGKYEDTAPSDEEKKQLEKDKVSVGDDDRGQKAGGGLDVALAVGLGGKNDNERSIELGIGAAALACLDGICEKLDKSDSIKVNPYLAIAITKSIAGRIDVVWDGTGHSLGDAFAGASLKYSFSRPKDAPAASSPGS